MLNFEQALHTLLKKNTLHPSVLEVLDYAIFPPGKLFRPKLLEAIGLDLKAAEMDVLTLGCALELHHAYSLVHDDMPCMDNDELRRGKPTTHKAFGEWKALLTGDMLLILSLSELTHLKTPAAEKIRRLFHWATGPKGLILGQWIDLDQKTKNFSTLMRMHELKTARLMQIATLGALWIAKPEAKLSEIKNMLRLGSSIGVAFQLLDDLDDLAKNEISAHEKMVNPFLAAPKDATKVLTHLLAVIEKGKLPQTQIFLKGFLQKSTRELVQKEQLWSQHIGPESTKVMKLLTSGICA